MLADRRWLVIVDQHAASCLLRPTSSPLIDAGVDALIAAAVSPTATLTPDAARALIDALYAEVTAGRILLEEAEWRGRRVALRVSAAELARRLES